MILVTGATGFLGSELVKQLLKLGQSIRAIKRETSKIPPLLLSYSQIEWVNADILDYYSLDEAFENIDEVYHCAAFLSLDPQDKNNLHKTNMYGTANVVNLCLEHNIKKLVHVSSIAAIGEAKNGELINEENHWEFSRLQNGYAISKYEAEMEVWRGIAEGLNAVIVNPSIIIGKNAGKEGSGKIFDTVRKGLKFYTTGSCGLVDVEDVAKTMISLMKSDISAERFILNSENISFLDLFSQTAINFGLRPPTIKAQPWMFSIGWRLVAIITLLTRKRFGFTKDTAHSAFVNQEYDNAKIRKAIGIDFKPINHSIAEICSALKNTDA